MTKRLKKSKKSEAQVNVDKLSAALKQLHDKRTTWQDGTYKRSNDELYGILGRIHGTQQHKH
jgi:ribosomal protein L18E